MSVSIIDATELSSVEGSGAIGDIKVRYGFSGESGIFDTSLEYKSSSGNFCSCWDVVGTIGANISVANTIVCYWRSTTQYGNAEEAIQIRLLATK